MWQMIVQLTTGHNGNGSRCSAAQQTFEKSKIATGEHHHDWQ
jgi:hypothetical protein